MKKLCGWLAIMSFSLLVVAYPVQAFLNAAYGVEGWEMAEVYPEMIDEAQADRGAFLAQFGSSEDEALSEQLSYVGRPGPFTEQGKQVRFVFVPEERIINPVLAP